MYAMAKTFSGRAMVPSPSTVCATPGTAAAVTPSPNIPTSRRMTCVWPAATLPYSMNVVHVNQKATKSRA